MALGGPAASRVADKGRVTKNGVPFHLWSKLLRPRIIPPCFCTIERDTHRPKPLTLNSLVVTNGSKIFARMSEAIPDTESQTIPTNLSALPVPIVRALTLTNPFFPTASIAFWTRFSNTWRSRPCMQEDLEYRKSWLQYSYFSPAASSALPPELAQHLCNVGGVFFVASL
jgi:hypothetical protein